MEKAPFSVTSPLNNLDYFVEWGGASWQRLIHFAIHDFLGEAYLKDKAVLDLGTRYGKMATFFALLGAQVTGIDVHQDSLRRAREETKRWRVENRVTLIAYDGDLDLFPDETFDVIFTKSVLVVVPELENFLHKLSRKLKPDGKVVFIENGYGNLVVHGLRRLRHRVWNYKTACFFKKRDLLIFETLFNIDEIKETLLPPIFLICGHKKT